MPCQRNLFSQEEFQKTLVDAKQQIHINPYVLTILGHATITNCFNTDAT